MKKVAPHTVLATSLAPNEVVEGVSQAKPQVGENV